MIMKVLLKVLSQFRYYRKMSGINSILVGPEPLPNLSLQGGSSGKLLQLNSDNVTLMAKIGADRLKSGGIIAIPTDTVYGLAADVQNNDAIARLYEIKGRDYKNPVAICVSEIEEIDEWAQVTVPRQMLEDFLPGPVTLVFERQPLLNPRLNSGTQLIGIRIPNYEFTRQLSREMEGPFTLTSANPSSTPSTICPKEFKSLWSHLDCVFDGGKVGCFESHSNVDENMDRSGSTVIDLSKKGSFRIIRPGIAYDRSIHILKIKYSLEQNLI